LGYSSTGTQVDEKGTYPSTQVTYRANVMREVKKLVFQSGPMHKTACYYSGSTALNIPRVNFGSSSNTSIFSNALNGAFTINSNYLESADGTRTIGIFINTQNAKKFVITKDVELGYGGRTAIVCYDANGNVLTSSGTNAPYVKGISGTTPTFYSSYGGSYELTGTDTEWDVYFSLHDDVKSIRVIFYKGTNNLRIRSFSIFSIDGTNSQYTGNATAYTGYEEIIPGVNLASTPPTAGTWSAGRRIINGSPTVGQPKSWICTASGTPGTWVSEGNL
jgi:hypothetical protein